MTAVHLAELRSDAALIKGGGGNIFKIRIMTGVGNFYLKLFRGLSFETPGHR